MQIVFDLLQAVVRFVSYQEAEAMINDQINQRNGIHCRPVNMNTNLEEPVRCELHNCKIGVIFNYHCIMR